MVLLAVPADRAGISIASAQNVSAGRSHASPSKPLGPNTRSTRSSAAATYSVAVAFHLAVAARSEDGMGVASVVYAHLEKHTAIPVQCFTISPQLIGLVSHMGFKIRFLRKNNPVLLKSYVDYFRVMFNAYTTPET